MRLAGFELQLDDEVYAPREDTELLLRALGALPVQRGARACDVGTGTGIAALALAERGCRVLALDVGARACALARRNAAANGLADRVEVARGGLLDALRGPFEVVAFNPPYLPVADEGRGAAPRAWEGGEGGIAWAPRFLDGLARCLAPRGHAVVVLSSVSDRDGFRALARQRGFACSAVATAKVPWETLEALQVRRANL